MDAAEFYDIVEVAAGRRSSTDYPWLKTILTDAPKGASLEGFLWPATYRVLPDTTPEELVRLMLDKFVANVGAERLAVPAARGLTFYQVLTLASIVEREAHARRGEAAHRRGLREPARPEEVPARAAPVGPDDLLRPRHARARQAARRRLDEVHLLGADQGRPDGRDAAAPTWPATTPTPARACRPGRSARRPLTSIDAALEPDTKDGYLYFLAKGDGSGTTAFAKTLKEHQANVKKYLKP